MASGFVEDELDLYQVKETYRQLKKASESNNDKIEARNYGAAELEYYLKFLKSEKANWFRCFPLLLSKRTNDFGRSWPLAFWSLIAWSVFFYLILGVVQSYNFDSFLEFIISGKVFIFLNPVHSLESVLTNEAISKYWFGIHSIDFFQRLFSGFNIYQLIRAFRFHYNT